MEKEIWKNIKGYEGLYKVSQRGRVMSLDRMVSNSAHTERLAKGRVLSQYKKENGYMTVTLSKDNSPKPFYVHRLVGDAFIPTLKKGQIINHIDEVKDNNNVSNLEWCSYSYNIKYNGARKRAIKKRNKGGGRSAEKKISQYSIDGTFIRSYTSVAHASRVLGLSAESIRSVVKGRSKRAGGFQWGYYSGKMFIEPIVNNKNTSVIQYTMDGVLIKRYNSIAEASRMTNSRATHIHLCCNALRLSTNGFKWTYNPLSDKYKPT